MLIPFRHIARQDVIQSGKLRWNVERASIRAQGGDKLTLTRELFDSLLQFKVQRGQCLLSGVDRVFKKIANTPQRKADFRQTLYTKDTDKVMDVVATVVVAVPRRLGKKADLIIVSQSPDGDAGDSSEITYPHTALSCYFGWGLITRALQDDHDAPAPRLKCVLTLTLRHTFKRVD